jgi:hypothetical protein
LEITHCESELVIDIALKRISLAENGFVKLSGSEERAIREYLASRMSVNKKIRAESHPRIEMKS